MDTDPMAVEDDMAGRERGNEAESIGYFIMEYPFTIKERRIYHARIKSKRTHE